MKRCIIGLSILFLFCSFVFGNNLRNAADFFEWLLIEDYEKLSSLLSPESDLTIEQLKEMSADLQNRYGFIISYHAYETDGEAINFVVQMEYAKLKVILTTDQEGMITALDYQPYVEVQLEKSQITINTIPENASVYVNGIFQGWTPMVLKEYPGVYQLEIHKNGFLELSQVLQLSNNDKVDFELKMTPAVKINKLDYMKSKSILLNSFDKGGWIKADWVSQNITSITLSDEHVTQGKKSLAIEFNMDDPGEMIVQYPYSVEPRNLAGARLFFVDLFLDYNRDVAFSIALQAGDEWKWIESESIQLKKGMNYSLPIRFINDEDFEDVKIINLKLYFPSSDNKGTIYFDNLRYFQDKEEMFTQRIGFLLTNFFRHVKNLPFWYPAISSTPTNY